MPEEIVREASRPAAGALRVGIDVSIANVIMAGLMRVLPPDIPLADVEVLVLAAVAAGIAAIGKQLRSSGNVLGEVL